MHQCGQKMEIFQHLSQKKALVRISVVADQNLWICFD